MKIDIFRTEIMIAYIACKLWWTECLEAVIFGSSDLNLNSVIELNPIIKLSGAVNSRVYQWFAY